MEPESFETTNVKLDILSENGSAPKETVQPTPEVEELRRVKSSISEGNADGATWTVSDTDADNVTAPCLDINAESIPQAIEEANGIIERWIDEEGALGSYDMWIVAFTLGPSKIVLDNRSLEPLAKARGWVPGPDSLAAVPGRDDRTTVVLDRIQPGNGLQGLLAQAHVDVSGASIQLGSQFG